jgi:hypothetical protein
MQSIKEGSRIQLPDDPEPLYKFKRFLAEFEVHKMTNIR